MLYSLPFLPFPLDSKPATLFFRRRFWSHAHIGFMGFGPVFPRNISDCYPRVSLPFAPRNTLPPPTLVVLRPHVSHHSPPSHNVLFNSAAFFSSFPFFSRLVVYGIGRHRHNPHFSRVPRCLGALFSFLIFLVPHKLRLPFFFAFFPPEPRNSAVSLHPQTCPSRPGASASSVTTLFAMGCFVLFLSACIRHLVFWSLWTLVLALFWFLAPCRGLFSFSFFMCHPPPLLLLCLFF